MTFMAPIGSDSIAASKTARWCKVRCERSGKKPFSTQPSRL